MHTKDPQEPRELIFSWCLNVFWPRYQNSICVSNKPAVKGGVNSFLFEIQLPDLLKE